MDKYYLGALFVVFATANLSRGQAPIKFEIPVECKRCDPDSGIYHGYRLSTYYDHAPAGSKKDFMGGKITYDGHRGNDFSLAPFPFYQMDSAFVNAVAAAPGVITKKVDGKYDRVCSWTDPLREGWNIVEVQHAHGIRTKYGHLSKNSLTSKNLGDSVSTGDYLGIIGSSGKSANPHLHFEVIDSTGDRIDPFLGPQNTSINESWWKNQPSYPEPIRLNWLMTGSAAPDRRDCPLQDLLNKKTYFSVGDTLVGSFYFNHANRVASTLTARIIQPDGVLWDSTSGGIRAIQNWTHVIPQDAQEGKWTYEILHKDSIYDVNFKVDQPLSAMTLGLPNRPFSHKNYPDPFSSHTEIHWNSDEGGLTKLVIYNSRGEIVSKLLDSYKSPGKYKRTFNAGKLGSGFYFYRLRVGDRSATGKMIKEK